MEKGVTIIMPVLNRVLGMEKVIKSAIENTEQVYFILVRSLGEVAVSEEMNRLFRLYDNVEYRHITMSPGPGDYARKINSVVDWVFTEWFLAGADDIKFHPKWFENAMKVADPSINVIGTNDLGNPRVLAGTHTTHPLIRTSYAQSHGLTIEGKPGEVMSPAYWHEYMDDELVGVAKKRNCWAYAGDSIVEHLHPNWGKAPMDESYNQQKERMRASVSTFATRRQSWM